MTHPVTAEAGPTDGPIGDRSPEAPTPSDAVQVAARVREIAAANPDYVYQPPEGTTSCRYVDPWTGRGSCIVGRALIELDLDDWIIEGKSAGYVVNRTAGVSRDDVTHWLDRVQANQDLGHPWARAVALADAGVVENIKRR